MVPGPGRGVPAPGGCLVPGDACSRGGAWSGGCSRGGVPALGGQLPWGCLVETPPRLLLRVVRILLECILVKNINHTIKKEIHLLIKSQIILKF